MQGPFSRAVALHNLFPKSAPAPRVKPQPLWGMGSKRFGGRYTPKNSFETIYMAKDIVTTLEEVHALISIPSGPAFTIVSPPWVIVAIHGILSSVLDLTQAANVRAIGSSYQELTGAWRSVPSRTGEPPTHLLGRLCHSSRRFDGICYPSSRILLPACVLRSSRIACGNRLTLRSTILTEMWRRDCRSDSSPRGRARPGPPLRVQKRARQMRGRKPGGA
jgi:RES domain-containing protein